MSAMYDVVIAGGGIAGAGGVTATVLIPSGREAVANDCWRTGAVSTAAGALLRAANPETIFRLSIRGVDCAGLLFLSEARHGDGSARCDHKWPRYRARRHLQRNQRHQ